MYSDTHCNRKGSNETCGLEMSPQHVRPLPPLPLVAPRVDYLLFPRRSPASGPPFSAPFFCWLRARPLYLKPPSALPPRDPTSPIGFGAAAGRKEDNRRRTGINSESREGNLIVI